MPCGCGTIYTDKEIDEWIKNSNLSRDLMTEVKRDTRAMQEATGEDLLRLIYNMDKTHFRNEHLKFLTNTDTKRAGDLLRKHVDKLVKAHIEEEMKHATPFEPIVVNVKQKAPSHA